MNSFVVSENITERFSVIIDDILNIEQRIPKALMAGVELAHEIILIRLASGKNANGEQMKSRSIKTIGSYEGSYAKRREKHGLQTAVMDMSFTGKMLAGLSKRLINDNAAALMSDFRDTAQIKGLQKRFGVFLGLTNEESQIVYERITSVIFGAD